MTESMHQQQPITMLLANLKPHPLQATFASVCSPADDQALAQDIKANGIREPIQVLPADNAAGLPGATILDGHRRVAALISIGETEALVVVRHDLATASAAEVEHTYLNFNLLRRHLRPLEKARIALRMRELARKLAIPIHGNLRDYLGQMLGQSGRNLSRYLALLETPVEVQNAVDGGLLPLVLGARIATLSKGSRQTIASRISTLTSATEIKAVIREYLPITDGKRHSFPNNAFCCAVRKFESAAEDLEGRVEAVSIRQCAKHLEVLERTRELIGMLLQRATLAKNEPLDVDPISDGMAML
jgi:hypothetical protein